MLKIFFTKNTIFDLPGPSLYFYDKDEGFEKLSFFLKKLSEGNSEFILNKLEFVKIMDSNIEVIFKSSENGSFLNKIIKNKILIDLPAKLWENLFKRSLILANSEESITFFIEMDDDDFADIILTEDANLIWEC